MPFRPSEVGEDLLWREWGAPWESLKRAEYSWWGGEDSPGFPPGGVQSEFTNETQMVGRTFTNGKKQGKHGKTSFRTRNEYPDWKKW